MPLKRPVAKSSRKRHDNVKLCDTKGLKAKRGKRSKSITALEKNTATLVLHGFSQALTPNPVIFYPLDWLAQTIRSVGTSGKYTFNVRGVMEWGKDNRWHIEPDSLQITGQRLLKTSKPAGGKLTQSKTGK